MPLTIGLLHPGEMGAAVGAGARASGNRVIWASAGRSAKTSARANTAGLEDAVLLVALASQSDVILSVCPPHGALDVARSVAALGFRGLYIDANAVSPATVREIGAIVEAAGASFIDGGIIGLPPAKPGDTRLYMSGTRAPEAAALFTGSLFDAVVIPGEPGAASALKMAYAAWNKISSALLLEVRSFARAEGVEDSLIAEWKISQPDIPGRLPAGSRNAGKAWRFTGEMEEIAAAFEAADLPGAFPLAAREIYAILAPFKNQPAPTPEAVADFLRQKAPPYYGVA